MTSCSQPKHFLSYLSSLTELRAVNLTCKLSKCVFGTDNVKYLGFELSIEGLRPGQRKVSTISEFPVPRNVRKVRRFLGLSGFFRRFVQRYSIRALPLTEMTKADKEWSSRSNSKFVFCATLYAKIFSCKISRGNGTFFH